MKTTAPIRAAGLACLLLLISLSATAQFPVPPAYDCGNIVTLCNGELENHFGSLENIYNPTGPEPICGNFGTAHNTQWYSFVAGTENLTLLFEVFNCSGPGQGIQAGIISECPNPFWQENLAQYMVTCYSDCQGQNSFTLGGNFTPGKRYYLFLDGCNGAVCNYYIGLLSGSMQAINPAPTLPIFGPDQTCYGNVEFYETPFTDGASNYEWTTSVPIGFYPDSNQIIVTNWNGHTEVDICVTATNDCFPTNNVQCIKVSVGYQNITDLGQVSFCRDYEPGYYFTGNGIYYTAGNYEILMPGNNGCDEIIRLEVVAESSGERVRNVSICQGDSIIADGEVFRTPITGYSYFEQDPLGGCDSLFILNLDVLWPDASIFTSGILDCALGINDVRLSATAIPQPNMTYEWSTTDGLICNGLFTDPEILACAPGEYCLTVTISNASGSVECTDVQCRTITAQTSGPELDIQITNADCGFANGSISVVVLNPVAPPYTFEWVNPFGQIINSTTDLVPGIYSLTVTDANACSSTESIQVSSQSDIQINTQSINHLLCFGDANGSVSVDIMGGNGPFTYQWSANTGFQTGTTASGLSGGVYSLTVTDADNCSTTNIYTINEPQKLEVDVEIRWDIDCFGFNNGLIQVAALGGTPPFTFLWGANAGGQTTSRILDLSAGDYSVTITDANGCAEASTITINEAEELAIDVLSLTDVDCFGNANGSVTIAASGGTPPIVIGWSNGQSGTTATGLTAGTYTVTLYDNINCDKSFPITISSPPLLALATTQVQAVECFGTATGSASVSASGGTGNYTYDWGPNANNQNTAMASNLFAGIYVVTVTDDNSCIALSVVNIPEGPPLDLTFEETNPISCFGEKNGAIQANVNGGVPGFTYEWSTNAGNTNALSNLGAGNYLLTVTDATGCSAFGNYTLEQPGLLDVDLDILPASQGQADGEATATALGGTGPYFYLWLTNPPQASAFAGGLAAGNYQLLVEDANTCQQWFTVTVGEF